MNHQLGRFLDELAIDGMLDLSLNRNRDTFIHLVADDNADAFFPGFSFCCALHTFQWLGEPFTVPHQLPLNQYYCVFAAAASC